MSSGRNQVLLGKYYHWGATTRLRDYFKLICKVCMVFFVENIEIDNIKMKVSYNSGSLLWHHNEHDGVSNHQPHDCLLNRVFRRGSKKTSKVRVTGLCALNSSVTGEFPAQRASNAENASIFLTSSCWAHFILVVFMQCVLYKQTSG